MEIAQDKYVVEIKNGRNGESCDSLEWECWAVAQLSHRLYLVNNLFSKAYYVDYKSLRIIIGRQWVPGLQKSNEKLHRYNRDVFNETEFEPTRVTNRDLPEELENILNW